MNDQINVLLEVLEEIKQQNRELKANISNLPQPTESQIEVENRKNLAGIAKILEEQLEFHRQFREELCQVIVKLGERIHEMRLLRNAPLKGSCIFLGVFCVFEPLWEP
ncbi:hypothetical protein [Porphyromonas sp. COT-290 OH860]|uniref:hypothetical protein n=1 Tax=Porphyromonas sp. COT-290 OH860 TaxID=1515615 RepID=UPI001F273ABC|nr:hypothetical protein [Porphyromonas sp. COT-290 OH860]